MLVINDFSPEDLSALVDASAAINSAQGLDATLAAIARAAAAVMKAEGASVIILDTTRGKQVFRAAVGDHADQLIGLEYDESVGISGKVLKTGQAAIVNDVSKEKNHYKDIDSRTTVQTRSLIAAPLIHKDARLGVVEVLNPIKGGHFGESDRELCQLFANLAAIATANAQHCDRLEQENRGLKEAIRAPGKMIGDGPAMQEVKSLIMRVARSASTVLLLGQTGTGKELAAQMIHANSPRAQRPFIPINCAALPETLLESELFGHEVGAFTGAVAKKLGLFELAHTGTVFLDEIGEAAPSIQVKLLRVLENKEITRVGGNRPITCDVRVIAATNRDLSQEVQAGRFRDDLYYRLNVFPIKLPPLCERPRDIPPLLEHFIRRLAADMNAAPPEVSPEAMAALTAYRFPGNVRELQNILERACLLCCDLEDPQAKPGCIHPEHLPRELIGQTGGADGATSVGDAEHATLADHEKAVIQAALNESNWNQTKAAQALGISRDNLRYRVKKHGLKRPK